jgi:peptide/nickel transport system permease protein
VVDIQRPESSSDPEDRPGQPEKDGSQSPPARRRHSRFPWRALFRDKTAAASFIWIVGIVVLSFVGPVVSPYEVAGRDLQHALLPPFTHQDGHFYVFGTDGIGRDLLTRLLAGGRVSLSIGALVALISGTLGVTLGVLAGFYRGWVDDVIMRVVDVFMALPTIFFVLLVLYIIGPDTLNLILVMSIARWMLYCRVTRGLTLSLREQTFITTTRTLGASKRRIMARHLVPNMLSTILTIMTIDIARVILLESSISFLGLGLQSPAVSWGLLIADGRDYITTAWWLITIPGLFIFLTALSINLFGLWLRMVNDPTHRWRYLRDR